MADLRRTGPYIWATWLSRLLAGDDSCEWAIWFKAQHYSNSWTHRPRDSDLSEWLLKHTALVRQVQEQMVDDDYVVTLEDQNKFSLKGSRTNVVIEGKPDIIAVKDGAVTVVDAKTGQPRNSDSFQVLLYMYALSQSGPYKGMPIEGKVVYPAGETPVPYSGVSTQFINSLVSQVGRIASSEPPSPTPSPRECAWCDITDEDCPDRVEGGDIEAETDAF